GLHPGGFRPGSRPGESPSHSCARPPTVDVQGVAQASQSLSHHAFPRLCYNGPQEELREA
ncbi:MAG: hypothetical protein V3U90_02195, partial [Dehalococcoidia bacterium]